MFRKFLVALSTMSRGSPKSTMVKYGQNDIFFYPIKTFTFEKRKKFMSVHKQCFDIKL